MMRKIGVLVLCALLMLCGSAQANSWGLTGELLQAVSGCEEWRDYHTLSEQVGKMAVMQSRYHNALMMVQNGALKVYTRAVYQPDDSMPAPRLTANETGFSLRYQDDLWFSFVWTQNACRLHSAQVGQITLTGTEDEYRYLASDSTGAQAVLMQRIHLEDFNIRLMPRTLDEVRHLNQMRAALDGETMFSTTQDTFVEKSGSKNVPVLSAPFEGAWRAAKGKAAVSLKGGLWMLFPFRNQDGAEYWCIRYDVSQRTQRIGFIPRDAIDPGKAWNQTTAFLSEQVRVVRDTWLTDDPDVSQYQQFRLPADALLTCIGRYGNDYAVVSAEVKNGQLADGGQMVWGFVPLRDLTRVQDEIDSEAMQRLTGQWMFSAGGISVGDHLELRADGTFTADGRTGRFEVRKISGVPSLYWNDASLEISFFFDDGTARVEGLSLRMDTFSLTGWEGSGGYERVSAVEKK